ncbi:hypothetical protein SNEBB_008761 [Seison nebaliae]|nr:hypothetical protein SNEBB_008761 [Seison nebaliae]
MPNKRRNNINSTPRELSEISRILRNARNSIINSRIWDWIRPSMTMDVNPLGSHRRNRNRTEQIPRSSMSSEVTVAEMDETKEWHRRTITEGRSGSPPPRKLIVLKKRILETLSKSRYDNR